MYLEINIINKKKQRESLHLNISECNQLAKVSLGEIRIFWKGKGFSCITINIRWVYPSVFHTRNALFSEESYNQESNDKYFNEKRLQHRWFPVNFAKFLRTPFLHNTSGRLLLSLAIKQQPSRMCFCGISIRNNSWLVCYSYSPHNSNICTHHYSPSTSAYETTLG